MTIADDASAAASGARIHEHSWLVVEGGWVGGWVCARGPHQHPPTHLPTHCVAAAAPRRPPHNTVPLAAKPAAPRIISNMQMTRMACRALAQCGARLC
jgi:hypothetical protein